MAVCDNWHHCECSGIVEDMDYDLGELILAWAKANKEAGMFDSSGEGLSDAPPRAIVGGIKGGQGGSTSL